MDVDVHGKIKRITIILDEEWGNWPPIQHGFLCHPNPLLKSGSFSNQTTLWQFGQLSMGRRSWHALAWSNLILAPALRGEGCDDRQRHLPLGGNTGRSECLGKQMWTGWNGLNRSWLKHKHIWLDVNYTNWGFPFDLPNHECKHHQKCLNHPEKNWPKMSHESWVGIWKIIPPGLLMDCHLRNANLGFLWK